MFEASVISQPKIQLTMSAQEATELACLIGEFGYELELSDNLYDVLSEVLGGIKVNVNANEFEELRTEAQNAIVQRADYIRANRESI